MQNLSREVLAGRCLLAAVLGIALLYVALALTPSHYAVGLQMLGIEAAPLAGEARPIRSDEWIVMTPLFQIAVLGEFATTNLISPYREPLKGFWALPILDWSLIFKPQLWGFWVLPPAYAYSLYFATLWVSFLAGYTILLRQLGASLWLAAAGSLALYCSHYVQVWWTSNAPTFAFAAWPLVVFLLPLRPMVKAPLLLWASAVWVFGYVYPPFMIPTGFGLAALLLAFRRDAITLGNVTVGGIALLGLAAAFLAYYGDLIAIMSETVYPGQRFVGGGGFEESKILAHLLPYFTSMQFLPLLHGFNECEVAVVATLLPLTILAFVKYSSVSACLRVNAVPVVIIVAALTMMLAWMMLPVPAQLGHLLLWSQVPPSRMAWGFGLLLTLAAVAIAARLEFTISWPRFAGFSLVLLGAWLASKVGFTAIWSSASEDIGKALLNSWFDWIAIVPFGIAALLAARKTAISRKPAPALFASAAISGLVTFGTFNPLQPAYLIFDLPETPFQERLRQQAQANPNGWAIEPGNWAIAFGRYGALLNGAGIPAINHTLMVPQLDFFRRVFPDLRADQFNYAFNRYAHIVPQEGSEPHSPFPDVVVVPIEPFTKPIGRNDPTEGDAAGAAPSVLSAGHQQDAADDHQQAGEKVLRHLLAEQEKARGRHHHERQRIEHEGD